jgi:hypothetical protein
MQSRIGAGVAGGLIAGVVFGIMMQLMKAPTPEGMQVPMMMMVAKVVRSNSLAVGWLYHLLNSAVIGGLFGMLLGGKLLSVGAGVLWGAFYGVFWWVLGGLILMPILLGMPAFSALRDPMMRPVAMGSFVGHLIFGVILGWATVLLLKQGVGRPSTPA